MAKKMPASSKPAAASKPVSATFAIEAPAAQSVMLAGDFSNWDQTPVSLKKMKGGMWKATLALEPGTYEYRFLVDGEWSDDPHCQMHAPNPFGSANCVRVVQ